MPDISDWQKGGVRYANLKTVVPAFLAPEKVDLFFVGVRGGGRGRLLNPFTPLQREYVIVATPAGVRVLKLKLPGVFRASVKSIVFEGGADEVSWDGRRMYVGDVSYAPISFHDEDAEEVGRLLGAIP
jgi:hypothetical protein